MDRYAKEQVGIGSRAWRRRHAALAVGFLGALAFATAASASEEHFDVLLYDDGSGNLGAGGVDVDTLTPDLGTVVVEGELFGDSTSGATPSFFGEDPGFFSFAEDNNNLSPPADNLPGGAQVSVDFFLEPTLGLSLAYWDDSVANAFGGEWAVVPQAEVLTLEKGPGTAQNLDGASTVTDLVIGTTGLGAGEEGEGYLDDHPDYVFTAATPGAYLIYGTASVAGLNGPSNPFWLVLGTLDECEETSSCNAAQEAFNMDIEEQIEAGIAYTEAVLVPEPSTIVLAGMGLIGLGVAGRSGRRRR